MVFRNLASVEPVVNVQDFSFLALLLELIRDEALVIPFFLPVAVTVGSSFLDVIIGKSKRGQENLRYFLFSFCSISQEVPARAVNDADVPVRQTYFALLDSTSSSSHSSVFPAALITSRDPLLKD